jgi:hypothetical protein
MNLLSWWCLTKFNIPPGLPEARAKSTLISPCLKAGVLRSCLVSPIHRRPDGGFKDLQRVFDGWGMSVMHERKSWQIYNFCILEDDILLRVIAPFVKSGGVMYGYMCAPLNQESIHFTFYRFRFDKKRLYKSVGFANAELGVETLLTAE